MLPGWVSLGHLLQTRETGSGERTRDVSNSLGIGQRLVYSSLYGCIYGVPGVQEVTDLWLSTDGGTTYGKGSVNVFEYGIVVCERVDVEVTS